MLRGIPESEFQERIRRIQEKLEEHNFDAYLVHSNEADQGNIRYLSDYWPLFESAGVIIPREGEPILLVGPESETFARERSKIRKVRKLLEYREPADPEYPEIAVSTFRDIFDEVSGGKGVRRLALGDYTILPMPVVEGIKEALGEKGEIVRAEWIIAELRSVKSANEIALLREAHRISELVLEDVLHRIRPGMTEREVLGVVYESMYRHGAECEAFPNYVFGGKKTRNAIGRATDEPLREGELIQLCIGARFGGYASSVGRPIIFGKMPEEIRKRVQFGLDAHRKTLEWIREGVIAGEVAVKFYEYFVEHGYAANYLYGPCHGTGIIEVEKPWMEKTSSYPLQENMTFMADTFFTSEEYGFRWEDGFRVAKDGVELFSSAHWEILEL
ncbi:M24 family metallopeptidase [Candidatus Caldatribacterium saccharofermentans]|uniref:M24 family metallopeptidase n=1 Tax=Candidatus Caldatribacterium saccharofermentans TaxID=1454753 RepID=UPI003D07BD7F